MIGRHRIVWAGGLAAALLGGCQENSLIGGSNSSVAVTTGDFDRVAEPLLRMEVAHDTYEGIISTATWDPEYEAAQVALKVEDLFGDANELGSHSVTIVASGTRGLGERQYNSLDPDDHIVSDETVITNVRRYVDSRGVLVVTDWGYDLVEAAWPDAIDFLDDDGTFDAAQHGLIDSVAGRIVDEQVADILGYSDMAVHFDYSNQAIIEDVDEDVQVIVRGSVRYVNAAGETVTEADSPLMVMFQPQGATGKVVLTTFHLDAQSEQVIDDLLLATVGSFTTTSGGTVAID